MTQRENILYRIIAKGGLYGQAAVNYLNDPENGDKYIIECFNQCSTCTLALWGEDLVLDIISYVVQLKNLKNAGKV